MPLSFVDYQGTPENQFPGAQDLSAILYFVNNKPPQNEGVGGRARDEASPAERRQRQIQSHPPRPLEAVAHETVRPPVRVTRTLV